MIAPTSLLVIFAVKYFDIPYECWIKAIENTVKEKFVEIGTRVIVSDPKFIEVCNDKWKTYQYLKENGFNVPKTYLSLSKVMLALESGELNYPIIVKPTKKTIISSSLNKIFIINSPFYLRVSYTQMSQKVNKN